MNKTKKLLFVAFGLIFALSSYNLEICHDNYCKDGNCGHFHEIEEHDKHDHESYDVDLKNSEINLGNNNLGISILSRTKTSVEDNGIKFGVHKMGATSGSDSEYGSIQLQANYSPKGCLTDSIWSVSDSLCLKITPNATDSSICNVVALKEFDGEVTIKVRSKFYSDVYATIKATYVGGFKIEVIKNSISLSATRKCDHKSTNLSESTYAKSNLSNYFKVKYKGNLLNDAQIYRYINSGDLIVTTFGDINFNNNSTTPYFYMKDLSSSSSSGSKSISATLKVKEDPNRSGSISGTSKMNIGSWTTKTGEKEVNSICPGIIKQYSYDSYEYYCNGCGASSTASNYNLNCGKSISDYRYRCNSCGKVSFSSGTCSESKTVECKGNLSPQTSSCDGQKESYSHACGGIMRSKQEGQSMFFAVCDRCGSKRSASGSNDPLFGSSCTKIVNEYKCSKCGTTSSTSGTCSQSITTFVCAKNPSHKHSSLGYCTTMVTSTCGGTKVKENYSYNCSGIITRKSVKNYYYQCSSCNRSATSSDLNKSCGRTIVTTRRYNYCSVCKKEL